MRNIGLNLSPASVAVKATETRVIVLLVVTARCAPFVLRLLGKAYSTRND